MKKKSIHHRLSKEEREAMKYGMIEKEAHKLCNDPAWRNRMSTQQILEYVTNTIETSFHKDLVKKVSEINLAEATEFILYKLIVFRNRNINEYYTEELPTKAFVGVDYLKNPALIVESDENTVKQMGVVLGEFEYKGLHPKVNIRTQLKRSIRNFLENNPIKAYPNAIFPIRNQGEILNT